MAGHQGYALISIPLVCTSNAFRLVTCNVYAVVECIVCGGCFFAFHSPSSSCGELFMEKDQFSIQSMFEGMSLLLGPYFCGRFVLFISEINWYCGNEWSEWCFSHSQAISPKFKRPSEITKRFWKAPPLKRKQTSYQKKLLKKFE